MKNLLATILVLCSVALSCLNAQFGGCTADFRIEMDSPTDPNSLGPRVFEVINVNIPPGGITAIGLNDEIANLSGWVGAIQLGFLFPK